MSDIDGIAVAGMWGVPGPGLMQPNLLVEYLGIKTPKWIEGTNIGGSTFLVHVNHAFQAINAGLCDTVLVIYGSLQKSNMSRVLGDRPALYSSQFEVVSGLPLPVGGYALAAQKHMSTYGSTRETLAEIAVSTRAWATMNENAAFKEHLTIYKNNKDEKNFYSVFALSSDGKVSGDMDGWGKKVSKTQIEALAVAECMTNNKKEKCFIYAINDEVVWK